jgi:hypothetical protein
MEQLSCEIHLVIIKLKYSNHTMSTKKILTLVLMIAVFLSAAMPANAVIEASNLNSNFSSTATFMGTAKNVANFMISFITILGIIFIVWGAIQYITSGGNEEAVNKAKSTVVNALVGLFIAAMAYALEDLVLAKIVG